MIDYKKLPVYQQKKAILASLKKNQVVIVESPTGSGKTTQLPIILHAAKYSKNGIIGITQPRRIATLSVCEFIAKQLSCEVGETVGYKMRFDEKTSNKTKIKIMTDGTLLQELKSDPLLTKYSVILIDEAHERTLNIDFILGLLKKIIASRSDLKVIISSATINSKIFSDYFCGAPIVEIKTKVFPVDTIYKPIKYYSDYDEELNEKIVSIVHSYITKKEELKNDPNFPKGDILIFLQGEKNIKDCYHALKFSPFADKLFLLQLYSRLSKEEQERVFIKTPEGKTKVVIATNIAETSLTIDGVCVVIDSGLAKINFYNPSSFTAALIEKEISKASANQRKGRAGRTQSGICYRLYSEQSFNNRSDFTLEEIYRTDLSEVLLRMSELGITDFEYFNYISPPKQEAIISAIETLKELSAIDFNRNLTNIGKLMVKFPLLPRHSRILVESILKYPDVIEEVTIACSFLSNATPFLLPIGQETTARSAHTKFYDKDGDFLSYLKIFKSYKKCQTQKEKENFCDAHYFDFKTMEEISNVKEQLCQMLSEMGIPILSGGKIKNYLLCLCAGLIQYLCVSYKENCYKSLKAEKISIHPGSLLFKTTPQYIVASEIVKTSKTFARSISPIKREWLDLVKPNLSKKLVYLPKACRQKKSKKYK